MASNENSSGSPAATVLVCVPRETHRVDGLEWIERKPWKHPTAKGSERSIRGDYAIRVPSSEFSEPTTAAHRSAAFIALEVEVGNNARCGQGPVRRSCIEEGYAWDGAPGPRFDTCGMFQPALVHDTLYRCMPMLRLTRCRRRRTEKLTDTGQLTPGDPLGLGLRSLRIDWLNEGFQPVQDGGSLRPVVHYGPRRCPLTIRSRLAPIQRVVTALREHWQFRLDACRCRRVCASAMHGAERQGETGSRERAQVQIRRAPHKHLGPSLGRSTGTRTCPHVLLKVEVYRHRPNKECAS